MSKPSNEALAAAKSLWIRLDNRACRSGMTRDQMEEAMAEAFDAFARPLMVETYCATAGTCCHEHPKFFLEDAEEWVTARLTAASPEKRPNAE